MSTSKQLNGPDGSKVLEVDASDYHPMATVTDLLITLREENKLNGSKCEKQQYTFMEFVDKKTGEILTQRVVF